MRTPNLAISARFAKINSSKYAVSERSLNRRTERDKDGNLNVCGMFKLNVFITCSLNYGETLKRHFGATRDIVIFIKHFMKEKMIIQIGAP